VTVEFNAEDANRTYTGAQGRVDVARSGIPGVNDAGLNDPKLTEALGDHNTKTAGQMDATEEGLERGKDAVKGLDEEDKRNGRKMDRLGGPDALKNALAGGGQPSSGGGGQPSSGAPSGGAPPSSSGGGGSPSSAPAASPAMSAVPAGQTKLTPDQLSRLLSGAGVTPDSISAAKADLGDDTSGDRKRKDEECLNPKDVQLKKTGIGTLRKSQMLAVIDRALDNNGISRDPSVRGRWREMMFFMAQHESSLNPDAVNLSDPNAVGPRQIDGAPAKSSRGLLQTIPPTFAAYHLHGTSNNIYDPVANTSASVNYILHHYHVDPNGGPSFDRFYMDRKRGGYRGY
jgi:hypothetical protein